MKHSCIRGQRVLSALFILTRFESRIRRLMLYDSNELSGAFGCEYWEMRRSIW